MWKKEDKKDKKKDDILDQAVIALKKGDKEALSDIYDCMARTIFSVAYGITGHYQDAEDVLQNTMIEIVKYAYSYQKGSSARAWILTMARHCAIDVVRKRKSAISVESQTEIIERGIGLPAKIVNEGYFAKTEDSLSRIEVLEMLRVLREEERQIIILKLYAGLRYQEISNMMGISVPTAQKKYQRGLKKLKKYIVQ